LDAVAVVVPLNMFEQVEVFSFQVRASAGTEYVIAVHCDTSSGSASP
jgi:aspartate aminotransferase-like enzyme